MRETFSSNRRIGIRIDGRVIVITPESGLTLAYADDHCDFEIELSGTCGNHVVRLNLSEPRKAAA